MGEYNHHLHYRRLEDRQRSPGEFREITLSSADFWALAQKQVHRFEWRNTAILEAIYQRIANYSPEFTLFTKSTTGLALLPHDRFIGKPDEAPVPVVQMIQTSNTENYFYPRDGKFVGRMSPQPEILDLAMPYLSVSFWERDSYSDRKDSWLHLETVIDFEEWKAPDPHWRKKYPLDYPEMSRAQILQNLEFLLGFIPSERPVVIEEKAAATGIK